MLTEHEIQLRVRYSETDPMGFVHHSNYLVYCEMRARKCFGPQEATIVKLKSEVGESSSCGWNVVIAALHFMMIS